MNIFIILRAKAASPASSLADQLESLLGAHHVHELRVSDANLLSLEEHVTRLRRQWLKFQVVGSENAHIISSSVECEIVKSWMNSHPEDFQSATFINGISTSKPSLTEAIKKIMSSMSSFKDFFYYWRVSINILALRALRTQVPLLLLQSSEIDIDDKNSLSSVIKYQSRDGQNDERIEEVNSQWVANQVYTWINREKKLSE